MLLASAAPAQGVRADGRWRAELAAFAAADQAARPGAGGVLFVGSSSIRLWEQLPRDFSEVPLVINRGFGGSTMADCHELVRELVVQYRPRQVLVYAGDNDLADGRTPAEVLESFQGFVKVLREELPDTRIDYIAVKPSPARARLLPQARETNALLANYVAGLSNASFIDVFTPMLDATGAPRADLFRTDRLHLNEAGYALWRAIIAAHVVPRGAAQATAAPVRSFTSAGPDSPRP